MTDLRDQLQASLGDHYRLEAELGGGGMSHVFVAQDLALGRRVVAKLLPDERSGSVSVARFKREISIAARLQHPNIVPLLSVGELDGLPYYIMPLVDGESLRLVGRSAREIGATLGVGAVLQGAVSGSASRLHVTAEPVRASDENSLWSSRFDAPVSELVGIQDTIERAVAAVLHVGGADVALAARGNRAGRGTADAEAYDLFLQGRYANDVQQFDRAVSLLRAAVGRDPNFARAHAYLAMAYGNSTLTAGAGAVDSVDRLAKASADRALALDSTTAEAYVAESFFELNEGRFAGGVKKLEHAIALDSGNPDIRTPLALNLAQIGRLDEGLIQARRARDEDPVLPSALGIYGYMLLMSGHPSEALEQGRASLAIAPAHSLEHQARGFQRAFAGVPDSALAEFETAFRFDSTAWGGRSNLVFGYALTGRWSESKRQRELLERDPPGRVAGLAADGGSARVRRERRGDDGARARRRGARAVLWRLQHPVRPTVRSAQGQSPIPEADAAARGASVPFEIQLADRPATCRTVIR